MQQSFLTKLIWVIGTIIVCVFWFFVSALIFLLISIIKNGSTPNPSYNTSNAMVIIMIIGWIALIIISIRLWKQREIRCPNCKKWGAMFLDNTKVLKKEEIYVPIETKSRNLQGTVYGTQEQYVPGQRTTYRDIFRCKYCGATASATRTRKKAKI